MKGFVWLSFVVPQLEAVLCVGKAEGNLTPPAVSGCLRPRHSSIAAPFAMLPHPLYCVVIKPQSGKKGLVPFHSPVAHAVSSNKSVGHVHTTHATIVVHKQVRRWYELVFPQMHVNKKSKTPNLTPIVQ